MGQLRLFLKRPSVYSSNLVQLSEQIIEISICLSIFLFLYEVVI